jgi:hypothetical protein
LYYAFVKSFGVFAFESAQQHLGFGVSSIGDIHMSVSNEDRVLGKRLLSNGNPKSQNDLGSYLILTKKNEKRSVQLIGLEKPETREEYHQKGYDGMEVHAKAFDKVLRKKRRNDS